MVVNQSGSVVGYTVVASLSVIVEVDCSCIISGWLQVVVVVVVAAAVVVVSQSIPQGLSAIHHHRSCHLVSLPSLPAMG